MRQRANSVRLIPEVLYCSISYLIQIMIHCIDQVEEPCIRDLGQFCMDRTGRGEEMECLQEHLDRLSPSCRIQVSNYTEEEAEHVELNPFITAYCSRFMETHCKVTQH